MKEITVTNHLGEEVTGELKVSSTQISAGDCIFQVFMGEKEGGRVAMENDGQTPKIFQRDGKSQPYSLVQFPRVDRSQGLIDVGTRSNESNPIREL